MVAVATGLAIEPLIRDSRWFALCQIGEDDRILRRRFAVPADRGEDPFVTLPHTSAPSGAPILERAITWMDCELIRHVDLDSDHRLYVGRVHHAGIMTAGARPVVEVDGAIATIQDNSAA